MEQIKLVDFIKKAEQDQIHFDFRVTTMDFKESDKSNELDKFRKFKSSGGTDPDKCSLIWEVYQKLWDIDDKNREAYTGDTMNSVMRTLNKHLKINEEKVSEKGEEFLSAAYTIGNFIPVPAKTDDQIMSFNQQRNSCYAKDYWDRTLYCIYCWYMDNPSIKSSEENGQEENDKWLKKLLLSDEKQCIEGDATVTACKRWLKAFHYEKDNPSWDAFVEKNYLQDYTLWSTKPYGPPKEFWEGHFPEGTKKACPQTSEQIEAFFTHATACIKARSARMVKALNAKASSEMRKLTIEQIIEELSFGDAMWQFVRFDEESDAFVYSITRTQEDGSLAEELILYDGDMEDLPYAEEEAFKRQIVKELRSGDAKLQFVRFDVESDAFVYSITRTQKDGSLAENLILYDGDMDKLLSALEDAFSEEEKAD